MHNLDGHVSLPHDPNALSRPVRSVSTRCLCWLKYATCHLLRRPIMAESAGLTETLQGRQRWSCPICSGDERCDRATAFSLLPGIEGVGEHHLQSTYFGRLGACLRATPACFRQLSFSALRPPYRQSRNSDLSLGGLFWVLVPETNIRWASQLETIPVPGGSVGFVSHSTGTDV